ncbi:Hpt domain-containing protein [Prochlorothrix hollandica]|uniref:Hpt domain-containing protein n=1 Tax=Prochlorothrix hollandica TaxID=1223 RepID=UPI00034A6C7E|nr:Hpt domain-containing protein [Prochlorothrix hollandica]
MDADNQQRILGYFIEEAKDHLETLGQGLQAFANTLADPEMLNELFRAAHSIKGGAAMLNLGPLQQVAAHLEDDFKILKDHPHVPSQSPIASLFQSSCADLAVLLQAVEQTPQGNYSGVDGRKGV